MNKKKLLMLLGLSVMLGITGCGNKETESAETEFSTDAPEELAEEDLDTLELAEEDAEEAPELEPITPSDYLLEDTSEYVALGDLDGLEVTQYSYDITNDLVQEQIEYELEMYSEEVEAERASVSGDIIYVDLTSSVSGQDETTESTYFYLGDEEYGAEFDEQLIGLSVGDTAEFSITFSDEIWIEEWVDQTVDFKAAVTSVCELTTPEYNDDFVAENTEYSTMEEYEESLKESMIAEYEELSYSDAIEALFAEAEALSVFSGYPDELYEACKEELLSIYFAFTGTDNIDDVYAMFDITEESLESEIRSSVSRRLLINAICQEKDLEVTEEEYMTFLEEYAEYYGYDSAAAFEADYTREVLVWSLYESKAAEALYTAAKVTEVPYEEELFDDAEIIEE